MAVYSPPMPAPVKNRNSAKLHRFHDKRGGRGGDQIERERDEEQPLAPEPIGEPAEEQRPQHRAGEIGTAHQADLGVGEMQPRAFLERRRDGAGQRHLETIEDPGDPERHDHERMEPAPSQPVEPRRDIGRDDRPRCARRCVSGTTSLSVPSWGLRQSEPGQGNDLMRCRVPRHVDRGVTPASLRPRHAIDCPGRP